MFLASPLSGGFPPVNVREELCNIHAKFSDLHEINSLGSTPCFEGRQSVKKTDGVGGEPAAPMPPV
jgi:hypothetical protein